MKFDNLNDKKYKEQLKYFNSYYGDKFRKNQGTEEILDMIHKYSVDGDLIDFGSGSNIYFWLLAFNDIKKVHCVDLYKEAFYINNQVKNKELIGKSYEYPMNKYHKKLDDVTKIDIRYYLKDMLSGQERFSKTADNVSQFGLLGLCRTKKEYCRNFKKLFVSLKEGGVFLGANWIFSESYAKNKKFTNNYLSESMIEEMSNALNSECLFVKKVKIWNDQNYDYVLMYAIKKGKQVGLLDIQRMRLINNGVMNNFASIDECTTSLIGIQSQYYNYALISLFNRIEKLRINDIKNNDKIIKSWGQRTTLHLYNKKDYNLISDLYNGKLNWVTKKALKQNIDLERYLKIISNYVKEKDYVTKKDIDHILPDKEGKLLMKWSGLLIESTYRKILYGLITEKDKKIYKRNDIKTQTTDFYSFIERYFQYYGPATIPDFLHWSGLRQQDLKKELNMFCSNHNYLEINNDKYYYISPLPTFKKSNQYIALGKFDPLLVSYHNKNWILGDYDKSFVWKKAGQIEGVILNNTGIIATWHYKLNKEKVSFYVRILNDTKKVNYTKIEKSLENIANFLKKKQVLIKYERGEV